MKKRRKKRASAKDTAPSAPRDGFVDILQDPQSGGFIFRRTLSRFKMTPQGMFDAIQWAKEYFRTVSKARAGKISGDKRRQAAANGWQAKALSLAHAAPANVNSVAGLVRYIKKHWKDGKDLPAAPVDRTLERFISDSLKTGTLKRDTKHNTT